MSYKILIDPGHAPGNANKGSTMYYEYAGMWKLSNYLKAALEKSGFFVALSRTEKQDPMLTARGQSAKGFDLFISEHSNAANGVARGVEVFYSVQVPDDRSFAAELSKAVAALMNNPDRGAKIRVATNEPAADYYSVMNSARKAGCPHVLLIENGFRDNPADEAFLLKDENLKAIANAQAGVIQNFFMSKLNVKYMDELISKAAAPGLSDERVDNGITNIETALSVLSEAGIVNTPEYWREVAGTDLRVKELLITLANRCRIVLEKIVHAEARGEGLDGQILVANVVMNRCKNNSFPNGIYNVVFQSSQFSPVTDGAYTKAIPSASVKKAVDSVLDGEDNSRGALYFCTKASAARGNWHERALEFLFESGNHRFYK